MTLTHVSPKYPESTENSKIRARQSPVIENNRTEKMEFLDSDTDREIETDVEESKSIQKYRVSLLVGNDRLKICGTERFDPQPKMIKKPSMQRSFYHLKVPRSSLKIQRVPRDSQRQMIQIQMKY